ncbi:hypothetical protein MYX64_06385 [Nitrospinae bacterium AH_259_B05_G02_I21]|nr:hypothetical protein [Nitrospinae bacterium AH_259_B05_G02_I21]
MYRVTLKPGHPKGVYHRSGRAFTEEPVHLSEDEMTPEIRDDIWLNVESASGGGEEGPDWPEGATELIFHINNALDDHDSVQAILDWEMEGKQRSTVVQAAQDRLNALDVYADPEGAEPAEGVEA